MDQQKQPTPPETKTAAEAKPAQPQQQKVVLPQSQDNNKPANPSSGNQAPPSKQTQTQGNA